MIEAKAGIDRHIPAMKRKYLLIDLWAERLPSFFSKSTGESGCNRPGATVISSAHPERNCAPCSTKLSLADDFRESSESLLQGNLQCLLDEPDTRTRRTMEQFSSRRPLLSSWAPTCTKARHAFPGAPLGGLMRADGSGGRGEGQSAYDREPAEVYFPVRIEIRTTCHAEVIRSIWLKPSVKPDPLGVPRDENLV